MSNRFLTTNEVAELVRTPPETVRYWRHIGEGPKSFKAGRRVLYAHEEVEAWLVSKQGDAPSGGPSPEVLPESRFTCPHCGGTVEVRRV